MRLICTKTLKLCVFVNKTPQYAILSHRWSQAVNGEATLQDYESFWASHQELFETQLSSAHTSGDGVVKERPPTNKTYAERLMTTSLHPGIRKVLDFCRIARENGHEWAWCDTVCIDKTNNVELAEAINSMYNWYKKADYCFVYLRDVHGISPSFTSSLWFRRGWTLQELLAPTKVGFYDASWRYIGSKATLEKNISKETGVPSEVLVDPACHANYCAAQKMSWAADRRTSSDEDIAYCLLGLFGVTLDLRYGEGAEVAFRRLQTEYFTQYEDETLLLWHLDGSMDEFFGNCPVVDVLNTNGEEEKLLRSRCMTGVLAKSPRQFSKCKDIEIAADCAPDYPFGMTNRGLSVTRGLHRLSGFELRKPSTAVKVVNAEVLALPLACRNTESQLQCHIVLVRDVESDPIVRWCRVHLPGREIEDINIQLRELGCEAAAEGHLFARMSWPLSDQRARQNDVEVRKFKRPYYSRPRTTPWWVRSPIRLPHV